MSRCCYTKQFFSRLDHKADESTARQNTDYMLHACNWSLNFAKSWERFNFFWNLQRNFFLLDKLRGGALKWVISSATCLATALVSVFLQVARKLSCFKARTHCATFPSTLRATNCISPPKNLVAGNVAIVAPHVRTLTSPSPSHAAIIWVNTNRIFPISGKIIAWLRRICWRLISLGWGR